MFTANTQLTVSELSFDAIKDNFKEFVRTKTEFEDYNFEGATINYVLDILAYDTYMKSIYTNMAVNETFIDTAQIRANLVSNAKRLGYTPKSARSAKASIIVTFAPSDSPSQIVIPKGTIFQAVKDGVRYLFSTTRDYNAVPNFGVYSALIDIHEGNLVSQQYNYLSSQSSYELINSNVDLSTLEVSVRENLASSTVSYYTRMTDLTTLTDSSTVYFLQENSDEDYEIYFGEGVLGKKPPENALINISYITTSGKNANGIRVFNVVGYAGQSFNDATKKYAPSSITVTEPSAFGADRQSLESIRFGAINNFPIQGRLVTRKDFEDFVRVEYDFVQSINVWGGEENDPPLYGKTLLCLKPFGGYALTEQKKDEIIYDMKKRNVLSIDPVIVDPIFTYIVPEIAVNYDSSKTINSADTIYNNIARAIAEYETNDLNNFGKIFRFSTFIRVIDKADPSILSNKTTIKYEKRIVPIVDSTITYNIGFHTTVNHPYDGYIGAFKSTGFKTNVSANTLYLEDNGYGVVYSYFIDSLDKKIILNKTAGTIDYQTGKVKIIGIRFTEIENNELEIKFRIEPENVDLEPEKNNILLLATPSLRIVNNVDRQITKSGVVVVDGNVSPIYTTTLSGL